MENIVDVDRLDLGKHSFDFQLDSAYFTSIDKTELLGGNVSVKAIIDVEESSFSLHIQINGDVQVTCDRCLDPMELHLEAEDDLETENNEHSLDLNWLAYEMIVVNLPLVHSHREGGCNPEMAALLQNHLCSTDEEPEIL